MFIIDYASIEFNIVYRLLNGYGPEKHKMIIHKSFLNSGLGNQLRSLWGSVAISLVSGRRLRSNSILFS